MVELAVTSKCQSLKLTGRLFTYAETEERKKTSLPKKVTKGTLGVFAMRLYCHASKYSKRSVTIVLNEQFMAASLSIELSSSCFLKVSKL